MKIIIQGVAFLLLSVTGYSQIKYTRKAEAGLLIYKSRLVRVDPGPDWKGYNLEHKQNGVDINIINGLSLKELLFAGIGIGYVNFQGIHGVSVFGDVGVRPLKARVSPVLDLKIGYNHIWNQYEGGTGELLLEGVAGIDYIVSSRFGIYLQSGILLTQQSSFYPLRVGVRF